MFKHTYSQNIFLKKVVIGAVGHMQKMNGFLWPSGGYIWSKHFVSKIVIPSYGIFI